MNMARSMPPGDIQTQPNGKIVFNGPHDDSMQQCFFKVVNLSAFRITFRIRTTNTVRFGVDPPRGVLDPRKAIVLTVYCDQFTYGLKDQHAYDRITIEWTNIPDGGVFLPEWFQEDGTVRRKNIFIEYNP